MQRQPAEIQIVPAERVDVAALAELYRQAGWQEDTGAEACRSLERALRNSSAICTATDADGRLVGIMRALSDGVSDAYMLDLVVAPECRGSGLGVALVETLRAHLQHQGIEWVVCIAAPGTMGFYAHTSATIMNDYTPLRFLPPES